MTREEAINVIRSIYQTGAEKEALAILVPELRESEDERKEWCRTHGYQPTDEITVRTFITQTVNDYGGDVIRQLAERYDLKLTPGRDRDNPHA